jgi:hypothetical protein
MYSTSTAWHKKYAMDVTYLKMQYSTAPIVVVQATKNKRFQASWWSNGFGTPDIAEEGFTAQSPNPIFFQELKHSVVGCHC